MLTIFFQMFFVCSFLMLTFLLVIPGNLLKFKIYKYEEFYSYFCFSFVFKFL